MSLGLLGAYISSSSSSSSSSENEDDERLKQDQEQPKKTVLLSNPFNSSEASLLPKPSFMVVQDDLKEFGDAADLKKNLEHSVFNNPFRVKEEKKKAILERHVEMTTKQEDRRTIEGKKVCWNFRKGRCRFGSKCTFAHDSDVKQRPNSETVSPKSQPLSSSIREEEPENPEAVIENNKRITKKRPGVSDSLTLGKKAMKFHDKVYGNSNK